MALPKRLFYVRVTGGKRPKIYEKAGGKYTSRINAEQHVERLRSSGAEVELWCSQELQWSQVS